MIRYLHKTDIDNINPIARKQLETIVGGWLFSIDNYKSDKNKFAVT